MNEERITWIDSAKGIAVIMIYVVHCVGTTFPIISRWTTYGQYGVEIFMLCNGFCSMEHYLRKGIENKSRYIYKKMIRIIPVFWLMLLITYLLNYVELGQSFNDLSHLLKNNSNASAGSVISSALLINFICPQWGYFSLFTETYIATNLIFVLMIIIIEKRKKCGVNYLLLGTLYIFAFSALLNLSIPAFENRIVDKVIFYFAHYNVRGVSAYFAGAILCFIYLELKDKERTILCRINKQKWNCICVSLILLAGFNCLYSNIWNSVFLLFR